MWLFEETRYLFGIFRHFYSPPLHLMMESRLCRRCIMTPLPLLLLIAVLSVLERATAQMNCAEAPTAAARIVCEQLHRWDTNARSAPPVTTKMALPPAIPGLPTPKLAAELAPIASSPYQCMDLGCLCRYGGVFVRLSMSSDTIIWN